MLQFGLNINNKNDKLKTISLQQLIHLLINTPNEYKELINNIKNIKKIDKDKFLNSLSLLPYFTFGIYNPPYIRKENFGCIYYLPLIFEFNKNIYKQFNKIEHIVCAFRTIENDKILVLFELDKPIYDEVLYHKINDDFINKFVKINFNNKINITKVKIEDCFYINHDKNLYYNENCNKIATSLLLEDISLESNYQKKSLLIEKNKENLTEEIINSIKEKVGITKQYRYVKKYKEYYEKIEKKNRYIIQRLTEEGIIVEIKKIFRGQKILLYSQNRTWAEINIFITEFGYFIIDAMKKGMDKDLIEKAKIILKQELIFR